MAVVGSHGGRALGYCRAPMVPTAEAALLLEYPVTISPHRHECSVLHNRYVCFLLPSPQTIMTLFQWLRTAVFLYSFIVTFFTDIGTATIDGSLRQEKLVLVTSLALIFCPRALSTRLVFLPTALCVICQYILLKRRKNRMLCCAPQDLW